MRILVVDDDNAVQSAVARALRADGHAVTTAADLKQARERVAEGVDLLVLDLRLPDGFGLDFVASYAARASPSRSCCSRLSPG